MNENSSKATLDGASLIAAERRRQIEVELWMPAHDDEHASGELADAAASYALAATYGAEAAHAASYWPWHPDWWKPASPVRMLVKAGALIAAEIDRRLRNGEKP